MEEFIHNCTAPFLADTPGAGWVADVSTFQGNLMTKEPMIVRVRSHDCIHTFSTQRRFSGTSRLRPSASALRYSKTLSFHTSQWTLELYLEVRNIFLVLAHVSRQHHLLHYVNHLLPILTHTHSHRSIYIYIYTHIYIYNLVYYSSIAYCLSGDM